MARRGAAAARAAAAVAEVRPDGPETKEIEWRGISLTVPAEAPGTLWFDMSDAQDAGGFTPADVDRLLKGILGRDGMALVRRRVADERLTLEQTLGDALPELATAILAAYGFSDEGESPASAGS